MKYIILLIATIPSLAKAINIPDISPDEITILNSLAKKIDQPDKSNNIKLASGSSCPVNSILAALAFRKSGVKEMEFLFNQFSVNDYEERSNGKRNIVTSNDVLRVIKDIELKYPGIEDGRLQMAVAFCAFKEENVWFNAKGNQISAARFFRAAFLAAVLKNTDIDVVEVSNSIDTETQRHQLSPNEAN